MRQIQIAGFLMFLFVSLVVTATAFSSESRTPILTCEMGALKVVANGDNSMTKQELLHLHHTLQKQRQNFDVIMGEATVPAIAFSVVQFNYDENAAARKKWRQIQKDLNSIHTVELSCDDSIGEEQQEEQEGGVTGGNLQ
jgi:hypothetical protein